MPSPKEVKRQVKRRKQVRRDRLERARSISVRSAVRTTIRQAREAIESGEAAEDAVRAAQARLDAAARRGVVHKNNAARRLRRLVNKLHAEAKN